MTHKLIFSTLIAGAMTLGVPGAGPALAAGHSGGGGHAGGMHGGSVHGSAGAMRGSFGRTRPGGGRSVGTGVIRHPGAVVVPRGGVVGSPYYYGGLGLGFGLYDYGYYDYDPWWGAAAPYAYDPYALPYDDDEPSAANVPMGGIRFDVTPKSADVYVDGGMAGTVDDFDGHFQQLKLPAGRHHIELRAAGYASAQFDVDVQPGEVQKLHDKMTKANQ